MIGIVDWASQRARMIIAFIAMSIIIGWAAYFGLPKEGEPDIEIPALFISVPFPGISAEDSERLLVKVMESKLQDLDGLKKITGNASESYAGVALQFEFGWNKTTIAPLGTKAMIYIATNTRNTFAPHCDEAYTVAHAPHHHQLLKFYVPVTRGYRITGTYRLDPSH